ncbi:MAG: hypothetical protein PUA62_00105 [Lachnospiraceae bacterium]|nr:hypothetical protein [Lachnospiraceae bacterium]
MFHPKSKSAKKQMEQLFGDIQINLENNYKDLAIGARKQAEKQLALFQEDGSLTEKDYRKLKQTLDDYTKRMEGYHH